MKKRSRHMEKYYDRFVDWLRGTPSPKSASLEEWAEWRKRARQKKVRYWLAEDGLDHVRDFVCWPFEKLSDLRFYLRNRLITRSHALVSNLKRGQWHDLDERLLHSCFDELVNFVEIEEAHMEVICSEEPKEYLVPWYYRIVRFARWRCPRAGLARLAWAASLRHNEEWEDKNSPDYDQPTAQAIAAKEILALYDWWKHARPKRPDPMEASGLSAYYDERSEAAKANGEDDFWSRFSQEKTPEEQEHWKKMHDLWHAIEEEQEQEDTDMMIRLVKIRRALWT